MKRSVLMLCMTLTLPSLQANEAHSKSTSLEGAYQNVIKSEQDEIWCKTHPEECQRRLDTQRVNEFKTEEMQEKEGFCERYPWRCESAEDRKERLKREKFCKRYPSRCQNSD
ncbi:MAG: hypothetical protein JSR17_12310 [Proteobacteria bacterium]|nr:hypothetical protein [Pseudomonadota bacterium]